MITPDSIGFRFVKQTRPAVLSLVCSFCPSDQDFAAGFLQIPPRGGHPCLRLTLPSVKARSGLSPYSYRPCRAHVELSRRTALGFSDLFHVKPYPLPLSLKLTYKDLSYLLKTL